MVGVETSGSVQVGDGFKRSVDIGKETKPTSVGRDSIDDANKSCLVGNDGLSGLDISTTSLIEKGITGEADDFGR